MNKVFTAVMGAFSGSGFALTINWEHIFEKGVETAILSAIGGITGALGGLLVYWVIKKFKQITGWKESQNISPTQKP